jgi:hypothetical protein
MLNQSCVSFPEPKMLDSGSRNSLLSLLTLFPFLSLSLSGFLLKINDPFHSCFIINLCALFVPLVEEEHFVINPSDRSNWYALTHAAKNVLRELTSIFYVTFVWIAGFMWNKKSILSLITTSKQDEIYVSACYLCLCILINTLQKEGESKITRNCGLLFCCFCHTNVCELYNDKVIQIDVMKWRGHILIIRLRIRRSQIDGKYHCNILQNVVTLSIILITADTQSNK